jgi:hypothetical protein
MLVEPLTKPYPAEAGQPFAPWKDAGGDLRLALSPPAIDEPRRSKLDAVAFGAWLTMLITACGFTFAVAGSIVLDATGLAF